MLNDSHVNNVKFDCHCRVSGVSGTLHLDNFFLGRCFVVFFAWSSLL